MHHVKPLPIYEHLTPHVLVGYNGFGKPTAFIANPEDVWFLTRDRPNASVWMIPDMDHQ
jgi:hypothetical protein